MVDPEGPEQLETTISTTFEVKVATNFQIIPENGGFVLLLGTRRLLIGPHTFGSLPLPAVEVFSAAFLSHGMLKDLAMVLERVVADFEEQFGRIPVPGTMQNVALLKNDVTNGN